MGWFTDVVRFPDIVPELRDGLVKLRAHRPGDRDRLVEEANDPLTLEWTASGRVTTGRIEHYLDLIEEGWNAANPQPRWAICTPTSDTYLGTIALRPHEWVGQRCPAATVSYSMHPAGRGRGLTVAALRLVAQHFFTAYGGQRIHWAAFRGNVASWKVARDCGFTWHATIPQATGWQGQLRDDWVASLGRDDDRHRPTTPWLNFPVLETVTRTGLRLTLREWRSTDAAHLEEPNHPEHYLPHRAIPPLDGFENWRLTRLEHQILGQGLSWCITVGGRPQGYVTIFSRGFPITDHAEIGYYAFPSARGQGIVSAAARAAVNHAFTSIEAGGLGVRRLTAMATADNEGSNRVLQGLGFRLIGREREVDLLDSGPMDLVHWDLLAAEW